DFRKTPEPGAGRGQSKRAKPIFVIQKHDATRLHYDFRLEINGVLASWAVPKGPSLDPDDKRLAVHVEDHPLDYATFEGVIPKGEYGGGPVIVWDNGSWETDDPDPAAAVRKGKLTVTLHGKKLRGTWTLARMRGRGDDDKDNWLLITQEDEFATTGGGSIVDDLPRSVLSKRAIGELAQSSGHAPKRKTKPAKAPRDVAPPDPSAITNAKRVKTIPEYSAQLCTLADAAPSGEGWVHEIKFDGYRLLAHKTAKGVTLISRNGHDWTARFRPIAAAVRALPCDTCVIDGEATIVDA